MLLRPYQIEAIDQTFAAWNGGAKSVLGVASTGLGKTIVFASILARHPGRTMVLAHREELIFQAADKIKAVTGVESDIEMAEMRAAEDGALRGRAPVVISTIQTQTAGKNGGRMARFRPQDFDLLVIDECHHAPALSYRRVIDHYRTNPNLRVLGVTATPDRHDEQALGQVFETVAFNYDLRFGIRDGWLVRPVQHMVHVDSLDLSQVRTTAGDLNGADLARVMEYERNLHEVASPTIELTKDGRKTLVFAASVAHAERLAEIFNRHKPGCAEWIHGGTPKEDRRRILRAYAEGRFQYLVNVGIATEGFDDPTIRVIVVARPTKSRPLYAQIIGRGTRPLPGIVDDPDCFGSAKWRREAIAASAKPHVEILDFVGNSGKHKLISMADILGGEFSQEVVEKAKAKTKDGPRDMLATLEDTEKELRAQRELQRQKEAARRAGLVLQAKYNTTQVDPFDVLGVTPWKNPGFDKGRPLTQKMVDLLERQGIKTDGLTFAEASQLCAEVRERFDNGRCSYRQARVLRENGYATDVTRVEASRIIDKIFAGRQRRPKPTTPPAKPPAPPAEIVRY